LTTATDHNETIHTKSDTIYPDTFKG